MIYIYQLNSSFYPYMYKITVTEKLTEEKRMMLDFGVPENNEVLARDDADRDYILSKVQGEFTPLSPTDKQVSRLNDCQNINAQLDDVVFYVENGEFPTGDHSLKVLQIQRQQERLAALEDAILQLTGI